MLGVYAIMWMNFHQMLSALRQGVIEIFELTLFVVVFHLMRERLERGSAQARDIAVGILAATAAMAKFLPAILLPYFGVKRRWPPLVVALVAMAVIALAAELALDWTRSLTLSILDPLGSFRTFSHSQSLASIFVRGFSTFPQGLAGTPAAVLDPGMRELAVASARVALLVAAAGFTLLFWIRRRSRAIDIEFALLASFMMFIPQWNQDYYQIFLLIPFSVLLARVWVAEHGRVAFAALLLVLYLGTGSVFVPFSLLDRALEGGSSLRVLQNLSLPALSNLVLLIVLAALYLRPAGPARTDRSPRVG